MTSIAASRRKGKRSDLSEQDTQHEPFFTRVAAIAAGLIAFIAAFDPNAGLRYGPFIAVVAFVFAMPSRFRIGATEWALVAFMLWISFSVLWTEHPSLFADRFFVLSSVAVIFIGMRAAIRLGKNAALAVTSYVLGCFYGLAQTSFQLISSAGEVYHDQFGRITQVGTLNVNYVAYTTITSIVLLVVLLQSKQIRSRRMRFVVIVCIGLLVVGAIATQTRGVRVSLIVLGLWVIVHKLGQPVKMIVTACLTLVVGVSVGWLQFLLPMIDYGDRSLSGLSGRTMLWESALNSWSERPFVGVGLGADRSQNVSNLATHNTFLGLGVTLGAIGVLLFTIIVFSALSDRLHALPRLDRRFRIIAIALAFTPILLTSSWEMTASGWVGLALLSTPIIAPQYTPPAISDKKTKKRIAIREVKRVKV